MKNGLRLLLLSGSVLCGALNHLNAQTSQQDSLQTKKSSVEISELAIHVAARNPKEDLVTRVESREISMLEDIPNRLSGLLTNIPGVYESNGESGVSKPVIRGMQGTRLVTLWNGLRIENQQWGSSHGMTIGNLGIASVDVVKGPNSLLYGADALGGVIVFEDQKLLSKGYQKLELQSRLESATLGTISSLSYRISFKKVRISAAGSFNDFADYKLPNGNYLENSRYREGAGKFAFEWKRKRWKARLNYMLTRSRVGVPGYYGDINQLVDPELPTQSRQASVPAQMIENHFFSLNNKWLNQRHTVNFLLGQTVNQLKKVDEVGDAAFNSTLSNSLYHLKWEYEIGGGFNLVSGVQGGIQFNRNGEVENEPVIPNFNQMDHGIYSVLSSKFRTGIDTWRIQAGLRYDVRSLEAFESELAGTFKRNYQSINGSIGLVWSVGPLSLRGNISTGFRSPHVRELTAIGSDYGALRYEIGNPNLVPELATQFDGTLEISAEGLEFVVNPFVNYIQNYIYASPTDSVIDALTVFEYDQITEVFLYGIDVGVHYRPHFANWLNWESTYSHIVGEGANGDDLPLMPQNRLTTSLKFTLKDMISGKFQFENIVVKHSAFFAQNRVSFDETSSDFYQLIDLGLNMKLTTKHPLEFGVGVRNLLNEGYVDHLSRLKNRSIQQTGRNIYVQMKFTFNHRFKKTPKYDILIQEVDESKVKLL